MADNLYVDKKKYDNLFLAFSKAKSENADLKAAWMALKNKTSCLDILVIDDIKKLCVLDDSAYLIGCLNTLLSVKHSMDELEDAYAFTDDK